jgi:predicted Zn-dependent peptidase
MNSRIFGQARKRGIVYDTFSTTSYDSDGSAWIFGGEVNAENAIDLFDLIAIELGNIVNGSIRYRDIEAAKSYALGRHRMLAQTADQIGSYYERDYFTYNEYENMEKAPEMMRNIKKTTMVRIAREFIESNISGLSVVSNIDKAFINELWRRIQEIV